MNTYTSLIDASCKAGNLSQALKFRNEMLDAGVSLNIVTYTALLDGLCENGKMEEAEGVFNEVLNCAGWSCELLLRRSATSRRKVGVHVFLSPSLTSLLYQIAWRSDSESESEEISVFWVRRRVYQSGHDGGHEWWW
ncbi:hypothetical protein ACLB2K_037796 [Fragaria x ananassa]